MSIHSFNPDTFIKEDVDVLEDILTEQDLGYQLIVHNDEVNTFD